MKGQDVIVRTYGDRAAIRKVWEVGDGLVYVASEHQYARLLAGQEAPYPIGFPAQDVFECCPDVIADLAHINWSKLKQWKGQ